mgnify:CR=1 FL=1
MMIASCSKNPYTEKNDLTLFMNKSQEQKIGDRQHNLLTNNFGGIYKSPLLGAYIASIGAKIANSANLNTESFTFTILNSPIVNAFASPGGYIYVTRGLIAMCNNEAELAFVIAHEIAHIQERHSLHQIVEIVGLSSLAWLIFGLDEGILEEVALVGINLWSMKKSRDFEKDSDLLALEFLENAGLKKESFILAIEKLTEHFCPKSKLDKSDCLTGVKSGWLATHPTGAERLKYLREKID